MDNGDVLPQARRKDLFDTFANLQVTVTDSAGRDVNGFGVLLLSESDGTQAFSAVGQGTCGCSMVPDPTHSPGSWSLLLLLALGTLKGLRAQRG